MANVKISQLNAASALTGSEVVPVVQGGTTKKVTVQSIANLASGGGGSTPTFDIAADGNLGSDLNISYTYRSVVPDNLGGATFSAPIVPYAAFNFSAQAAGYGGYGSGGPVTTAENITFTNVQYLSEMNFNGGTVVKTISFPQLIRAAGGMSGILINNSTALTSATFPNLVEMSSFGFDNTTSLTTLSFPSLVKFTSDYSGIQLWGPSNITVLDSSVFPVLTNIYLSVYTSGLTAINLPSVTKVNGLNIQYQNNNGPSVLTTIAFPNAVTILNNFNFQSHSQLTNVTIGTVGTVKDYGNFYSTPNLNFSLCNLTQASVDNILTVMASLDGTNGTTAKNNGYMYLEGGSNATPSQAGLDAKAVLLNRGWTISHN